MIPKRFSQKMQDGFIYNGQSERLVRRIFVQTFRSFKQKK